MTWVLNLTVCVHIVSACDWQLFFFFLLSLENPSESEIIHLINDSDCKRLPKQNQVHHGLYNIICKYYFSSKYSYCYLFNHLFNCLSCRNPFPRAQIIRMVNIFLLFHFMSTKEWHFSHFVVQVICCLTFNHISTQ